MKSRASYAWEVYKRLIPALMVLFTAVSITALSISTWVALDRSREASRQNAHLAVLLCGLVEPVAEASKIPTNQPRTPFGEALAKNSALTRDDLHCTPDPYDRR